ncbi:MAG: ABC transporter ATP-binding protein [Woeseiaceae bacterium]|nr:ABC transporter ATP-binding protein [Woeseiaceae bacterium]
MLQVRNLKAGYIRGAPVLKGLDLDLVRGDCIALMGRNGMGKTTFVKALMGVLPQISGSVRFLGQEMVPLPPYQISNAGIAYVPQGREIFPDFTVEQNLTMGRLGKPKQREESFDFVYEYFPILAERHKQLGGTMSGGQQQQLAIARALVGRPDLLLLDEPSEGIQPSIVQEMAAILRRIVEQEKMTVIVVEQNLELVRRLAHHIRFIENGLIKSEVAVDEINKNPVMIGRYLSV